MNLDDKVFVLLNAVELDTLESKIGEFYKLDQEIIIISGEVKVGDPIIFTYKDVPTSPMVITTPITSVYESNNKLYINSKNTQLELFEVR